MSFKRLGTSTSSLRACLAGGALCMALLAPQAGASAATAGAAQTTSGGSAAPAGGSPAGGALTVSDGVAAHQVATIAGTSSAPAGTTVTIDRLGPAHDWTTIATATTGSDGSFSARWRADRAGSFTIRAVTAGSDPAGAPTAQLVVYRVFVASWFGPGFYGQRTACGETMSPTLLGVAHRTLPCGTLVRVAYGGRSLTVPVVDRGPYARGVSWDLTTATAQALGLQQTARIAAYFDRGAEASGHVAARPRAVARRRHRRHA